MGRAEPRPDAEVAADVLLEPVGAHHALAHVAGMLGDALRRRVRRIDPELDPLEPEAVETPLRQQAQGARGDAASARRGPTT
jgi:hypothetical protein